MERELTEIQQAINDILNVKSYVRRKKKSQSEKRRELFISIINSVEQIVVRQNMMYLDLQLDFAKYDEPFLDTIDALIILYFGKEGADLISWYLWERLNPDGTANPVLDEDGNEVYISTPAELWTVLVAINPKYDE
jgi:hypothetical protein